MHNEGQAYLPRNIIPILTRNMIRPEWMTEENHNNFTDSIRALIELFPVRIDGLTSGFSMISSGDARSGVLMAKHYHDSEVTFTFHERHDKAISNLAEMWSDIILQHYYKSGHDISSTEEIKKKFQDICTVDITFIEPDIHHEKVVNLWEGNFMRIGESSGLTGKRSFDAPPAPMEVKMFLGRGRYFVHPICTEKHAAAQKLLTEVVNRKTEWNSSK